jgi:hypothetical protein
MEQMNNHSNENCLMEIKKMKSNEREFLCGGHHVFIPLSISTFFFRSSAFSCLIFFFLSGFTFLLYFSYLCVNNYLYKHIYICARPLGIGLFSHNELIIVKGYDGLFKVNVKRGYRNWNRSNI